MYMYHLTNDVSSISCTDRELYLWKNTHHSYKLQMKARLNIICYVILIGIRATTRELEILNEYNVLTL